jgi:hypothetical protein
LPPRCVDKLKRSGLPEDTHLTGASVDEILKTG